MKITAVITAFNCLEILPKGMLEANLKQVQSFCDEILVVEGACENALQFSNDGHSRDGTLEWFQYYKAVCPKDVILETRDGGWETKMDMYSAANGRARGDYVLWRDTDEFFHEKDILVILDLLKRNNPPAMQFYANNFWGGWDTKISDESSKSWGNELPWWRLFRNIPGVSSWTYNRPPTYRIGPGQICNDMPNIITAGTTRDMGIRLYHYNFVQESQIAFKHEFYKGGADYKGCWAAWQNDHDAPLVCNTRTEFFDVRLHPKCIKELIYENS